MKKYYSHIKEDFSRLRKLKGLKVYEVAQKANIGIKTIYNMFNPAIETSKDTIVFIAEAFSVEYGIDEEGYYWYEPERKVGAPFTNSRMLVNKPHPTPAYSNFTEQELKLLSICKEENITMDELKDALNHILVRRKRPNLNAVYNALIECNKINRAESNYDKDN